MTVFNRAWDLVKMPFVPDSVKETEEGTYEGDFYDPIDEKTRKIKIKPPGEVGEKGRFAGLMGGIEPSGTIATMPLDEGEMREPEEFFGRKQQIPFSLLADNRTLERLFVPEHLRRRGIGTGIVDALSEWKRKFRPNSSWAGIRPDKEANTEDMLRLWHSRGHLPSHAHPVPQHGMEESDLGEPWGEGPWSPYYATRWQREDTMSNPQWEEEGSLGDMPFEEGFREAQRAQAAEIMADQEKNTIYRTCENEAEKVLQAMGLEDWDDLDWDTAIEMGVTDQMHSDGSYGCDCWSGHPWWNVDDYLGDDWEEAEMRHEQNKSKFPASWEFRANQIKLYGGNE